MKSPPGERWLLGKLVENARKEARRVSKLPIVTALTRVHVDASERKYKRTRERFNYGGASRYETTPNRFQQPDIYSGS